MEARSLDWLRVRVRERGLLADGDAEALHHLRALGQSVGAEGEMEIRSVRAGGGNEVHQIVCGVRELRGR